MAVKKLTQAPTEQDLEVAINRVLREKFKWLPRESIKHQTTFSFTFGRRKISVDGLKSAKARADVILYNKDEPLAVFELKRSGVPLKNEDIDQGLSYARLLSPIAPLVIVTNGSDTRIIETHSGSDWSHDEQPTKKIFDKLISNAAKVAEDNINSAIETLMGTSSTVWQQAVQFTSQEKISELTESLDKPALPFAKDFLIPRKTTNEALYQVNEGKKLILVEGAPMIGKSSVLREIVFQSENIPELTTLYIEARAGRSILQNLADMLAQSLEWSVSAEEVRTWLKRLSKANKNQKLLLAIDNWSINDREITEEIRDLSSSFFGDGLVVICALNDSVAEEVVHNSDGRSLSVIGRRATRLSVKVLDDEEFQESEKVLSSHKIHLMNGARASSEFRQPWILRALFSNMAVKAKNIVSEAFLLLPPMLSLSLISLTRERFYHEKQRRLFQKIAAGLLDDIEDQHRDPSLVLSTFEISLVRRSSLEKHINNSDLQWLIDAGFLRSAIHRSDEPVLYVGLPELLASELAKLIAQEFIQRELAYQEAADWFSYIASSVPIGDVIVAQAMLDIVSKRKKLPINLIMALLENSPKKERLNPGSRFLMYSPEDKQIEIAYKQDGTMEAEIDGRLHTITSDEVELPEAYANCDAWLVLSHFASMPFAVDENGEEKRFDPWLLLQLGIANLVLHRPEGYFAMRTLHIHKVPDIGEMVCHKEGVVEPITYAIWTFLRREDYRIKESWINQVIVSESMPLLLRVYTALLQLSQTTDEELSSWANDIIGSRIDPAFKSFPNLH